MTRIKGSRLAVGALALLVGAGTWAGLNLSLLRARYAAQKLTSATTAEERARWADELVARGAPGFERLIGFVKSGDDQSRAAAVLALDKHLSSLPEGDTRAATIGGSVLEAYSQATDPGKQAVLALVPTVLKRAGGTHADKCRAVVADALKAQGFDTRLAAVRLAMHPDLRLRAEVIPFLSAKEPELRSAGLVAVTSGPEGDQILADDELFRWLHDPDPGVRKVCHDALIGRDRTDSEIALAVRLAHPDATERLKLLLDLRYDDVADPEPWLERLSRDPEPGVRAGAARVMLELVAVRQVPCPVWVARVSDTDAHPTVRVVASYFRRLPATVPPNKVVPAGGP